MTYSNNPERHKHLSGLALALLATGNIITHSPAWQGIATTLDLNPHHAHDGGGDHGKNHGKDGGKHDPQHENGEKRFRTDNWRKGRHRKELRPR